jgi:hypothetical protein
MEPSVQRIFVAKQEAWEELPWLLSRPAALPPAIVKLLSKPSILEGPVQ